MMQERGAEVDHSTPTAVLKHAPELDLRFYLMPSDARAAKLFVHKMLNAIHTQNSKSDQRR